MIYGKQEIPVQLGRVVVFKYPSLWDGAVPTKIVCG